MKIPDKLTQAFQNIFEKSEMHKQKRGEETPEFYLSKNFLEKSKLLSYCEHKFLYSIETTNKNARDIDGLENFLQEMGYRLSTDKIAGSFFYLPEGFMGWHTNHTDKDWRIYFVKSLKGDSFFRYVKDGEIVTDYDPKGWSYRIFYVGDEANPFWHCVYGGSGRYSMGFRLKAITAA